MDDIHYIEFRPTKISYRGPTQPDPTLRIFDNKEKILVKMDIGREDYCRLIMYFANYNVWIQDKYNEI